MSISRRRRALLAAGVAAPLALLALRPRRHAGGHSAYFLRVQAALKAAGLARATLVIDRARLNANLAQLRAHLPAGMAYRIVAKSLPSVALIEQVRRATKTTRLMAFHQPFLNHIVSHMPDAQVLLGKPLPVDAAQRFYQQLSPGTGQGVETIEWLADTPQRIAQYAELARSLQSQGLQTPLRINLELDIGLHRGGFADVASLAQAVQQLHNEPTLRLSGLMGYEAHISKMPALLGGPQQALAAAMQRYAQAVAVLREASVGRFDAQALTLNAGGSSTLTLYDADAPCNELAAGSALLMPTDFEGPSLVGFVPACFIAAPVLKALDHAQIPGLERATGAIAAWDRNTARAFFIYGGYWLADAVSPPGLQRNTIWGHSSNQDLLNGSAQIALNVDDYVFLRPQQSEAVLLQFGDIAVYDEGAIVDSWPVFSSPA